MRCICRLRIQLYSELPKRTLPGFLEELREKFGPVDKSTLDLRLRVGRNRSALCALAAALPPEAKGFTGLHGAVAPETAADVAIALVSKSSGFRTNVQGFDGNLLSYMGWAEALDFVRLCLCSDAAWMRGAHVSLIATDLRLKGARTAAQCRVMLLGIEAHATKRTNAILEIGVPVSRADSETKDQVLGEMESASGYAFRRAIVQWVPDQEASGSDGERLFRQCALRFEVFVAAVTDKLRALELRWRDLPLLKRSDDAFDARMNAVIAGQGAGEVNFTSVVTARMKIELPAFAPVRSAPELEFSRLLGADVELVIRFVKIHQSGFGKSYSVWLGHRFVGTPLAGRTIGCFLSHFFERGNTDLSLQWVYRTGDELKADLRETQRMLALLLPELRRLGHLLADDATTPFEHKPQVLGPLTFLAAVTAAAIALGAREHRFTVIDGAWLRNSTFERLAVPGVPNFSGRQGPRECWTVRFVDVEARRSITINIPFRGPIKFDLGDCISVRDGEMRKLMRSNLDRSDLLMLPSNANKNPASLLEKIRESVSLWADSPEIMKCAEDNGGREFRTRHPNCNVWISMNSAIGDAEVAGAQWSVRYRAPKGSEDLLLAIPVVHPLTAERIVPSLLYGNRLGVLGSA